MKKFFALLLALAMVFAMSTTALAEETNDGSITVSNAVIGKEYNVYKVFDVTYDGNGHYSYTIDKSNGFYDVVSTYTEGLTLTEINSTSTTYVVAKTQQFDPATFASKLSADETKPGVAAAEITPKEENSEVKWIGLSHGYYFVTSSLGSLCALTTTAPNATVIEKNAGPSVDKKVQEGSSYGDSNDANIGDTVYFQTTITVQGLAKDYVLHDSMTTGLTFNTESVSVTLSGTTVDSSQYTVTSTGLVDGCTFEVDFTDDFEATLKSGNVIVVSYSATVNSEAVVAGDGNSNSAKLEYYDAANEKHETAEDKTTTYTWELNIFKYTTTTNEGVEAETPLAGAEFILYKNVVTGEVSTNKYARVGSGKITGWVDSENDATTLTSDDNGLIQIDGLDSGTYYLKETKAPAGYNIMAPNILKITIDNNGSNDDVDDVTVDSSTISCVKIVNNTGSILPETGGMGTTIFYVVGGLMMLGAVVLLVAKKKMSVKE